MTSVFTEQGRVYKCEILTKHLHDCGEEMQVDPDVWHDGLYYIRGLDYWGRPKSLTEEWAKQLYQDLVTLGYPKQDLRITLETHSVLTGAFE